MDIEQQFWVRVLLLDDTRACTLKIASSFTVSNPKEQTTKTYFDQLGIPINVKVSSGKIVISDHNFIGEQIVILPDRPHIFNLNGHDYRGKLKLILNSDSNSFDVINLVPVEPYLAGVVGAEMYNYWEPSALKAQAIAARTYCLYIKKRFGSRRNWDVSKTQANQVYRGVAAESNQVWDAVNKTYGEILTCKYPDGREGILPAYYSSSCGGHTENSTHVFGGDFFEPLAGVPCPYCGNVAKPNFFFWPMVQFDKDKISFMLLQKYTKLKSLDEIVNIIPAKKSNYGDFSRLTMLKLVGSTGKSDFLRAEDFRLSIDPTGRQLRSTICQIANMGDKWAFLLGRGYGHGVGMCQCGAQEMARQGKTAERILFYYYPGSKIVRVY